MSETAADAAKSALETETAKPARRAPAIRGADLLHALLLLLAAAGLGLAANALSRKPLPLLAADGPGALPELAPRLSAAELAAVKNKAGVLMLDVREDKAFARGHAPNALHAPITRFLETMIGAEAGARVAAAELVLIVCDSGTCPAGDRAYKLLEPFGHKNVRVLEGGWPADEASGLPVETGLKTDAAAPKAAEPAKSEPAPEAKKEKEGVAQ
jgi:3-mercaptopyruvate sulfurtransferase SseA